MNTEHQTVKLSELSEGLTLRDWFAGQALAGIMACPEGVDWDAEITARNAYKQADAMIAARKEKQ